MFNTFYFLFLKLSILLTCLLTTCLTYAEINKVSLIQVTKDVSYLASDELKGRHNYSPEIHLAADYIADRFKEVGLQPATNLSNDGFLQTFQLTKTTPQNINLTINEQNISHKNIAVASTLLNFSWEMKKSVKESNFTLHDVSKNDDARLIISRLNKQGGEHIVLINPAHETLFKRYQSYLQQGTTKLTQDASLNQEGGVIVMVLSPITSDKVNRLKVSSNSIISKSALNNVVAVLPGKTKPDEVVLYSAHYDHLGIKTGTGDIIFNGADDNASGVTAIINLAQYYTNQKNNARTLMFVAFSAEEIGGFGSSYFAKQLDPQKITAMINIEMVGKSSKFGSGTLWMTGMDRSNLGNLLNTVLAKSGKKIFKDPYPDQDLFYRSDNATLARLGVAAHSFSSVQLDNDQHYHQTSDDVTSLNLNSLHQVIETLAIATQPLVDGSIIPSRIDKSSLKGKGLIF